MEFPQMLRVRQKFDNPRVTDIPAEVEKQLRSLSLGQKVRPGQTVAITVGSRGIANIDKITGAIVQHFKGLGAVPFIVPALKLAASASVIGVVVAEISTGLKGGIGRLIIEYAREATSDPAKVFTAVFGAAALGLAMSGFVTLADLYMMRNRPKEASA